MYFAEKPFTTAILKSLRFSMEYELELRRLEDQKQLKKGQSPQNKVTIMCVFIFVMMEVYLRMSAKV